MRLDRIAPNRSIPFIDRGYFRVNLGYALGRLSRRSRWVRDFLEAATNSA
jgi:hypothetical protein